MKYPEVSLARSTINSETDNRTALRCSSDRNRNGYRYFALFGCLLSLAIAIDIAIAISGVDRPLVAVVVGVVVTVVLVVIRAGADIARNPTALAHVTPRLVMSSTDVAT